MVIPTDFSTIFQFLPGNYIILLPDAPTFTIVAFNEVRARETFTKNEHIGLGIFEAFPDNPDDTEANGVAMLKNSLETVLMEKKEHCMSVQKYDIQSVDRTGFEVRYWLPRNIPVIDDEGNVIYVIHHVQDMTTQMSASAAVTEQIIARKKIEDAEETLRLAIESADLGVYEVNLITDEMITSAIFNAIWGFDASVSRSTYVDRIHIEDREGRLLAHKASLLSGKLFYEARIVWMDNSIHWIKVKGTVLYDSAGEPARLLGVIQDITNQRAFGEKMDRLVSEKTKDLKMANERLEKSNKELQEFAHVTSHDLQEPLRKIQVFASKLLGMGEFHERSLEYLEKISASSSRMRGLINDLLDYSSLVKSTALFTTVDLNDVLQNVQSDFELLISQKKATILADRLDSIEAIPLQMNQLFYNLMGNALKFAKKNVPPIIIIKARKLSEERKRQFQFLLSKEYCEITFSDNGIGFEQEYAKTIFTIFQRLNDKSQYGGYGIGLAVCNKVVTNHQGIIYAEGSVNTGASFTIVLPYNHLK